jgi:hypothetical protein
LAWWGVRVDQVPHSPRHPVERSCPCNLYSTTPH